MVGVVNGDASLNLPDFRSSERTFSLLNQVAGRSGRGKKEGNVIIQTHNPDHYAIEFSKTHDYINFYNHEMKIRKELSYSPYFYMTSIKIISKDYEKAKEESNKALHEEVKEQEAYNEILEDTLEQIEFRRRGYELLRKHLAKMSERDREILVARKLKQPVATLESLSQKYGISRERVRQIEERAYKKLRDAILTEAQG